MSMYNIAYQNKEKKSLDNIPNMIMSAAMGFVVRDLRTSSK